VLSRAPFSIEEETLQRSEDSLQLNSGGKEREEGWHTGKLK
jgi:hypothetical protein